MWKNVRSTLQKTDTGDRSTPFLRNHQPAAA
jgi:hypothetical protein